jgi:hypothetical protein
MIEVAMTEHDGIGPAKVDVKGSGISRKSHPHAGIKEDVFPVDG